MRFTALAFALAFFASTAAYACGGAQTASTDQQIVATQTTDTQTKVVIAPQG